MFQKLIDAVTAFANWLGGLFKSAITYIVDLVQAVGSWFADAWINGWLSVLDFVLSFLPVFGMDDYATTIVQLRVYWAQLNNLIPLNTALNCALIYIDIYTLCLCIKFVNKILDKVVNFVKRFLPTPGAGGGADQ